MMIKMMRMRKPSAIFLLVIGFQIVLVACELAPASTFRDVNVQSIHFPFETLESVDLNKFVLAYCWLSMERDSYGYGRTDIVISRGDGSQQSVITYPIEPPQTPVSLGCLGSAEFVRTNGYGIAWRPNHNQLTMITGHFNPPGDEFYFVDVQADLSVKLPEKSVWEHRKYFGNPDNIAWSSGGEWLATLGENTADSTSWQNIWIYNPDTDQGLLITNVRKFPTYIENPVWSPWGDIGIGYGGARSGLGIYRLADQSYIDISEENESILKSWRYKLSWTMIFKIFSTIDPREILQYFLSDASEPVWVTQSRQIVFIAPASRNRIALFMVNDDGTDLQELLPGLPGLVGIPRISPDGNQLAFARYPGWDERDRAEIAIVDLNTKQLQSLLVVPAPANGGELYISGLDWTPDGKYIAFSSNHEGQSDIYIVSADGQAWINLTAEKDGDAIYPLWKP
jgi:Tol biopolymer transport system component